MQSLMIILYWLHAVKNGQKLQLVGDKETGSSYGFSEKGQNPELIKSSTLV